MHDSLSRLACSLGDTLDAVAVLDSNADSHLYPLLILFRTHAKSMQHKRHVCKIILPPGAILFLGLIATLWDCY